MNSATRTMAFSNYGHFTSMQVRAGAVRGIDLHLRRLDEASREFFGRDLPGERVRREIVDALDGIRDGSVRVSVFSSAGEDIVAGRPVEPEVLVSVRPPAEEDTSPARMLSVVYERELPHLKHLATLGLTYHVRRARAAGFDDALFVDRAGRVLEGTIWNIGFWDGERVVWPAGPMLNGIMMQLVRAGLERIGVPQVTREVPLRELPGLRSAFLTNSICPARTVTHVDDVEFAADPVLDTLLAAAYDTNPWQPL